MGSVCLIAPTVIASTNARFTILANSRAAYMFRSPEHKWTGHKYIGKYAKGSFVLLCMKVEDRPSSLRFDSKKFCYTDQAHEEIHPRIFHDCTGAKCVGSLPMVRPLGGMAYSYLSLAMATKLKSWSLWEAGSIAFERGENEKRIEQVMLGTPITARAIEAAFNTSRNK